MSIAAQCPNCKAHAGCTCQPPNIWWQQLPPIMQQPTPMGCICPPTSEQTCQNPICPRKGVSATISSESKEQG